MKFSKHVVIKSHMMTHLQNLIKYLQGRLVDRVVARTTAQQGVKGSIPDLDKVGITGLFRFFRFFCSSLKLCLVHRNRFYIRRLTHMVKSGCILCSGITCRNVHILPNEGVFGDKRRDDTHKRKYTIKTYFDYSNILLVSK